MILEEKTMTNLNKVTLIGRATKEPEIKQFSNGNKIANFSIATSEKWKDKNTGEQKEKTEFHRISVNKPGLISLLENYLKKGDIIYVEGKLQTRKYQDNTGNEKQITEIAIQGYEHNIKLFDYNKKDSNNVNIANNLIEDEIPF